MEEVFLKLDDDSNNTVHENAGYLQSAESTQDLVVDDGVKHENLSSNDVRINLTEFSSSQKLDWMKILWLQLTALLEVKFHVFLYPGLAFSIWLFRTISMIMSLLII